MNISVAVNLPPEVEERLRAESGDLSSAVRESFAINLFRRGILTHHDLGQVLGLDRFETDALLKRNDVTVLAITGNGLKTQDAVQLEAAPVIEPKIAAFEAVIGAAAGAVA